MSNGDIYRETILDHYRNPRNKGRLSNHDVSVQDSNPLCGDEIEIHLKVEANMIKDIKFEEDVPSVKRVPHSLQRW
jgi:nitrogen fixation protein NifU and related proteins